MYNILKTLENEYKFPIVEMPHAYRVAGVCDLWKQGNTIYVKPEDKKYKIHGDDDKLYFVVDKIKEHEVQKPFKNTNKHGITYQEFKHMMREEKGKIDSTRNEDYHWNLNKEKKDATHLYFLFHDNKVKIGRSLSVEKRLQQLKTGLSNEFVCVIIYWKGFLEFDLHRAFADLRLKGEWFKRHERIEIFIKKYWTKDTGKVLKSIEKVKKSAK